MKKILPLLLSLFLAAQPLTTLAARPLPAVQTENEPTSSQPTSQEPSSQQSSSQQTSSEKTSSEKTSSEKPSSEKPKPEPLIPLELKVQSIRPYNVRNQQVTLIEKDAISDLEVTLVSANSRLTTETFLKQGGWNSWNQAVSQATVTLLDGSFTVHSEPFITLRSKPEDPLKLSVHFERSQYSGKGKALNFILSWNDPYTFKQEYNLTINACQEGSQEQPPAPSQNQQPVPEPAPPAWQPEPQPIPLPEPIIEPEPSPAPQSPEEKPAIAAATPYIIIDRYDFGAPAIQAGKTFNLNIYFRNTSKTLPVENIMMSLETEEGLSITSSSNTFYIESLKPRETLSKTIQLKALGSDKSSSPAIGISFRYEYIDGSSRQQQTSAERIAIPVIEPDRFEVTQPAKVDGALVGEETVLSFQYVNKGKGTLSNVTATVEGEIPTLSKVQNLGNFEAGKSGSIDVVVTPEDTRQYNFTVHIQYENASGDPVELKYPMTLQAMEPDPIMAPGGPGEPGMEVPASSSAPSWPWWVIGLLIAGAIVGGIIWRKRKAKAKADNQQADDLDWLDELDGNSPKQDGQ